jgi:hypothetical protein
MAESSATPDERGASPMDLVIAAARIMALLAGVVLILVGAIYAVQVFFSVGGLLKDPAQLGAPVKRVEEVISADKLTMNVGGEQVEPGGTISLCLLLLWYMFWAWIPLALIAAGGRLVAAGSRLREEQRTK